MQLLTNLGWEFSSSDIPSPNWQFTLLHLAHYLWKMTCMYYINGLLNPLEPTLVWPTGDWEWEEIEDRVFASPVFMLLIHHGRPVSLNKRSLFYSRCQPSIFKVDLEETVELPEILMWPSMTHIITWNHVYLDEDFEVSNLAYLPDLRNVADLSALNCGCSGFILHSLTMPTLSNIPQ